MAKNISNSRSRSMDNPSEEFFSAFSSIGSIRVDCACGRTHFATFETETFFEEPGEFDFLIAKSQMQPGEYIAHDCSTVGVIQFGNKQFAVDCPCEELKRIESFIWHFRQQICSYIKTRCDKEVVEGEKFLKLIEKLGGN